MRVRLALSQEELDMDLPAFIEEQRRIAANNAMANLIRFLKPRLENVALCLKRDKPNIELAISENDRAIEIIAEAIQKQHIN